MVSKTKYTMLILFAILLSACTEKLTDDSFNIPNLFGTPEASNTILAVELEHHFDSDHVWILLDETLLISDLMTTDYTISAAWLSGPFEWSTGDHRLIVGIQNYAINAEHSLTLSDTTTIRITYNPENKEFQFFEQDGLFWQRD